MQNTRIDMDGPTLLDEASNSFLRAIKNEFGDHARNEIFAALKPILGKGWADRQIYFKLSGGFNDLSRIRIRHDSSGLQGIMNNKIPAIKSLRALTGCSLIEAKDSIEKSYNESVEAALRRDLSSGFSALPTTYSTNEETDVDLELFLINEIKNLRLLGWSVEMA